ncbi:hypothetical protein [Streptomyces sp. MUM 16J]|uniref:hypothetical protein n=1 Tax=Streptomyces sp. MUM 16J TaxID=2791988 RepID=UPI000582497A|nr:hypothetical protein [Streptomyces sp. MUM 16J]MCH0557994.1 hypothetical protein [Streptomyces sp. MUM 16J]
MTNRTASPATSPQGGMTMRVYTVDRYGTVTRDRGTLTIIPGNQPIPPLFSTAFPPCGCLGCRAGRAVRG